MKSDESDGARFPDVIDFYDLAARYIEESARSDRPNGLLKKFAHRYPEYAADLAELAYARIVDVGDDLMTASEEVTHAVNDSARRVIARNKPIVSIAAAANDVGLAPAKLADALRIDLVLLAKLEQHMVKVATIPTTLIDRLAIAIDRTRDDVRAYLLAPPKVAAAARYKSKKKPTVVGQEQMAFLDAMDKSSTISEENRAYWRSEVSKEDLTRGLE